MAITWFSANLQKRLQFSVNRSINMSQLCLCVKKRRGKCYSGEYRRLFSLQHKWNIPPALVSPGRVFCCSSKLSFDAALHRKCESAGGKSEANSTADRSQKHGLHRSTELIESSECVEWRTPDSLQICLKVSLKRRRTTSLPCPYPNKHTAWTAASRGFRVQF